MIKPVVLCILDGVGISSEKNHNAVAMAKMPFFNNLWQTCPHSELEAAGPAVGLPAGTTGNSEVGHLTIGAGRIINQFLRRFEVDYSPALLTDWAAGISGTVHMLGLCSDGNVHASLADGMRVARDLRDMGKRVVWDVITDGRDTPPMSAKKYIAEIIAGFGADSIASISGRYYAMDRDRHAERTQLAYDNLVNAAAPRDVYQIIEESYAAGIADEFIIPARASNEVIGPNDGVLFFNYRSDRARQILREFASHGFKNVLTFSQYGEGLNDIFPAILPDEQPGITIGDILAENGKSQLRIAETEKYNHVTYFFDSERTIDFPGEEKVLIQSPAVATFDMKPEMSASEITDALLPRLGNFDAVILNYANGDMVGHTGIESAAISAMETIDAQLARFIPVVLDLGGVVLITADHGNAEKMWNADLNTPWTAHTMNCVPFIVAGLDCSVRDGGLSDIAPTMLKLLGIPQPAEMTGKSLIA
ncbi:MAG: 2,3-bisphosphoglycerate-independent phosphoglycerate mutase [Rickettsiales bacterium]|jgi:2,3-bisphosphoglycerate-independent phosphoglycerate mutase|nr:2,3-bisphosphoglycerate-independent phosphoglycerate mutase [Rickettsiales bacterium]